jgi:hypothetical protein
MLLPVLRTKVGLLQRVLLLLNLFDLFDVEKPSDEAMLK